MSRHLNSDNFAIKASAWLMYSFSNLTLCKPDETKKGIKFIHELVNACKSGVVGPREQTLIILVANVLIHLQIDGVPPINGFLSQLPAGLRVLGCYIMAHQAYLKGEYEKGLGIVETSLSQGGEEYTIPTIYLYLSGAMNAMSVDNVELGKEYFLKAYNLAKPDGLIMKLLIIWE